MCLCEALSGSPVDTGGTWKVLLKWGALFTEPAGTKVPADGCRTGIPLTSDDVGPTAIVEGTPPGRVWRLASSRHLVDGSALVVVTNGLRSSFFLQGSPC